MVSILRCTSNRTQIKLAYANLTRVTKSQRRARVQPGLKSRSLLFSACWFSLIFIYLFLAALGLCCCTWAFSSCSGRRLLFLAVCGLLIVVSSLVAEHGL